MDLSHMIGLWLAGQSAGVAPGGVGLVYAPPVSPGGGESAAQQSGVGVYPFSAGRWGVGEMTGKMLVSPMRAGLALIGELEYGADGLSGFVPRLWSAVNLGISDLGFRISDAESAGMIGAWVNRGEASIGLSERLQFVDRFDADGVLGRARVVGFGERPRMGGGTDRQVACATTVQTTEDVAVADFPVMFGKLVDYLRFAVAAQVAGNGYDDVAGVLARSDRPTHAVVMVGVSKNLESRISDVGSGGIGAGVVPGDVCHSVVYDAGVVTRGEIEQALRTGETEALEREGVSWLRQEVGLIDD